MILAKGNQPASSSSLSSLSQSRRFGFATFATLEGAKKGLAAEVVDLPTGGRVRETYLYYHCYY